MTLQEYIIILLGNILMYIDAKNPQQNINRPKSTINKKNYTGCLGWIYSSDAKMI